MRNQGTVIAHIFALCTDLSTVVSFASQPWIIVNSLSLLSLQVSACLFFRVFLDPSCIFTESRFLFPLRHVSFHLAAQQLKLRSSSEKKAIRIQPKATQLPIPLRLPFPGPCQQGRRRG